MLSLLQLLLAVFAIYAALKFPEETNLLVPLACLLTMLLLIRIEHDLTEKKKEREVLLKGEVDRAVKREAGTIKDQDYFTVESLLWPKNELLLIDAVHSILKDLGLKISPAVNYHSVDRIVRIPDTEKAFGLEILMSEGEAENNHPKIRRALEFEKEKKQDEKTLIIASTHLHLPLSEKGRRRDASEETAHFLAEHHVSLISAYSLYELWQKKKGGENEVIKVFEKLYSHPGGIFHLRDTPDSSPSEFQLSLQ
ncbi:MAG: hypothetical protein HXY46_15080 [Syntrophaceae bacterium]|nr:hypothetical protein [Syntrophaceae bacterium]